MMYGHRLLRELFGLLFLFCGLLMLLSLWSYDIADPTFNHVTSSPAIRNAAGLYGAYLAGFFAEWFGTTSFLLALLLLAVGAGLVSRWPSVKWFRWIGFLLFYVCTLAFFSAVGIKFQGMEGGGLAGKRICELSYRFFSPYGSALLFFFAFLMAIELSFNVSLLALLGRFFPWLLRRLPSFGETFDPPWTKVLEKLKRISLPSLSGKALLEKLKLKKKERPRPTLDILSHPEEGMAPPPPDTDPEELLPDPGDTPEAGQSDGQGELPSLEENSAPTSPEKADASEGGEFVLEIEGDSTPPAAEDTRESLQTVLESADKAQDEKEEAQDEKEETQDEKQEAQVEKQEAQVEKEEAQVEKEEAQVEKEETQDEKQEAHDEKEEAQERQETAPSAPADAVMNNAPAPFRAPDTERAKPEETALREEKESSLSSAAPMPQKPEEGVTSSFENTPFPNARIIRPAEQPSRSASRADFPNARIIQPAPGRGQDSVPAQEKPFPRDAKDASMNAPEKTPPALPSKNVLPLPPLDLLAPLPSSALQERPDSALLERQGEAVIACLRSFNVHATLARITPGPVITMFEVRPAPGVKATRITNLADDLAMSLKAAAVRMQAPVPGTDTVGVEVPNPKRSMVYFREIVEDEGFRGASSLLNVALGKDTGGRPFSTDLARMPHLLVAGATGQGKSVCLNAILLSLLCRARPDEVQLILVDPKRVEFSMYADLPHLVHPVVTDMDLTKNALLWAIDEMDRRLSLFYKVQVRNITGYNERQARLRKAVASGDPPPVDAETGEPEDLANMPFLVIVVDELADLMMIKRKDVEGSIVRLAQMARAAGIHLIIATQRPSVDVVTGLIKVNFPCRIAFKVTSSQDSRTILDSVGAEKLLGMGDMLFKSSTGLLKRIHGAFVSDSEVSALVDYWKKLQKPTYKVDFSEFGADENEEESELPQSGARGNDIVDDPIYAEAIQFALENGKISISLLQRQFRIGFNRAARFVDQMERDGILSESNGSSRPRSVLRR